MTDFAYTVRGKWPFPLDMLRHDGSQPASPFAAEAIKLLSGDYMPDEKSLQGEVDVDLVIPSAGRWRPNAARWASFGWQVKDPIDVTDLPPENNIRRFKGGGTPWFPQMVELLKSDNPRLPYPVRGVLVICEQGTDLSIISAVFHIANDDGSFSAPVSSNRPQFRVGV